MNNLLKFSLKVIMVEDPKIGGYTAFFKQFPDIIAEGCSEDEVMNNLMNTVHDVFDYQSQIVSNQNNSCLNVIEKSIDFQVA
jgi:hypothetical protein